MKTKSYFNLMKEIHRSVLIFSTAPTLSALDFTFKLITGRSWEDYKAAEEKFKKSIFSDPKSTERTMRTNPEMSDKIAAFAYGECIES